MAALVHLRLIVAQRGDVVFLEYNPMGFPDPLLHYVHIKELQYSCIFRRPYGFPLQEMQRSIALCRFHPLP